MPTYNDPREKPPAPPEPWRAQYSKSKQLWYYFCPGPNISRWAQDGLPTAAPPANGGGGGGNGNGGGEARITCSHILLKHTQSRNPVSRRPDAATITRSRAEATQRLAMLRHDLTANKFEAAAREMSECTTFQIGGDLGSFKFAKMQASFSEAAFKLGVGEITAAPVATESGMHLILRTA